MKLNRMLTCFLSAVLLVPTAGFRYTIQATESQTEPNTMTATEILKDITFGYNIGNSLECYISNDWMLNMGKGNPSFFETNWGNPIITQELVDSIKSTGINAIRIPVTWHQNLESDGTLNEAWLKRVKEVVDYVIDGDTYCIINMHHDNGTDGWQKASNENFEKNKDKYASMWTQIAEYFEDYDNYLIFEGINEVLDESGNWSFTSTEALNTVNKYNQLFVDTVRSTGGNNANRCLIADTYAAGVTSNIFGGFVLPEDSAEDALIAEVHSYAPYPFCSSDYPDITILDEEAVTSMLANVNKYLVSNNIPTIIGEFGCVDKGNLEQRIAYADLFTKTAASYGIKCFWWDNGGDFKMIDRNTNKWITPEVLTALLANCGITWNEKDGLTNIYDFTPGDANDDGSVTIADAVMLQKWLLGSGELTAWRNVDLCKDEIINVFDLCLLKRQLISQGSMMKSSNWEVSSDKSDSILDVAGSTVDVRVNASDKTILDYKKFSPEQGRNYKISFCYQSDLHINVNILIKCNDEVIAEDTISSELNENFYEKTITWTSDDSGTFEIVLNGNENSPYEFMISDFAIIAK